MSKKLHLIGNAHLDPVWLWRWQEGYAEIKATFRSALDRIHENSDFIFTCACAAYYEWIEENEPEMFEEIRTAVQNGQWSIVGGMWIQPDMNTPSGESIARQLLYSQRYFEAKFGKKVTTGYNVDTFGHNAMLPQLLKKAGIGNYVWMRPSVMENPDIPEGPMLWEAPDGSRVNAYRIQLEYVCPHHVSEKIARTLEMSNRLDKPMMVFYGVGNHGGGPTIENLTEIDEYLKEHLQTLYSSPDRYFADLAGERLPLWRGELQHHASGCYSTCSQSKRSHRQTEGCLTRLERFSVLAQALTGMTADQASLKQNWKTLLFNEFHDIMGGCAIREAIDDTLMQLSEAQSAAAREENRLLQHIAWHVNSMNGVEKITVGRYTALDSGEKGTPLVVFNPHAFEADTTVNLEQQYQSAMYDDGTPVPVQRVRSTRTNGADCFNTLLRVRVPALGYRLVWAKKDPLRHTVPESFIQRPCLENEHLRADFDSQTGALTHLTVKESATDVLAAPTRTDVIDISACDTWAHGQFRFDRKLGEFIPFEWKLLENGPVRSVLRVRSRFGASVLEQRYMLCSGEKQLRVEALLTMQEKHCMIKLVIPTIFSQETAEIPYGVIDRTACGNEEHCQRFTMLRGNKGGAAVLNDGKYSYSAENGEIRLTIANTSIFADHYGQDFRDDTCRYMDQGEMEFRYAIHPFSGAWQDSGILENAQLLNVGLPCIWTSFHPGELPAEYSGLALTGASSVEAGAVKQSENGQGTVLRLVERGGQSAEITVHFHAAHRVFDLSFTPYEIKTVYVPSDPDAPVREVNLLEE